jgi:hypothetical protein
MKLEIVRLWNKESFNDAITVEPAALKRKWMTDTREEYAYRCLPLNIANQHGWAIYPNRDIIALWTGDETNSKDSVKVLENPDKLAVSHFGHGILTFSFPFLIRLDPGYSLYISGAPNHHIKGIQPCTGIFEADWATYSFTMNWRFTHANVPVVFSRHDPMMFFFPVPRNIVNETETKFSDLQDQESEYIEQYKMFTEKRGEFNNRLTDDPDGNKEDYPDGWQKHYFRGLYPDGTKCPFDHKTKLKPSSFE